MTAVRPHPLRIGVAACFRRRGTPRPVHQSQTLLYMEEPLAHWLIAGGALPLLLPVPAGGVQAADLVADCDGLVLQGGVDVSPRSYGEEPLKDEWAGDRARDDYERALISACLEQDVPLFAVCRGLQIFNVALGGSLIQDIPTQVPGALAHGEAWPEGARHDVAIASGSLLSQLHGGTTRARVNSVHHQAIARLGEGLVAEASAPDGIIEAVRYAPATFAYAVQWHPEYQDPRDAELLNPAVLRDRFLLAVRTRRES